VKFTETGTIHIELSIDKDQKQDWVKIEVIDTGIGIKQTDQSKLFKAFEQVHHESCIEGTGLGLHFSQKLAVILGGHITVDSEFGKGSHFTLFLPHY